MYVNCSAPFDVTSCEQSGCSGRNSGLQWTMGQHWRQPEVTIRNVLFGLCSALRLILPCHRDHVHDECGRDEQAIQWTPVLSIIKPAIRHRTRLPHGIKRRPGVVPGEQARPAAIHPLLTCHRIIASWPWRHYDVTAAAGGLSVCDVMVASRHAWMSIN